MIYALKTNYFSISVILLACILTCSCGCKRSRCNSANKVSKSIEDTRVDVPTDSIDLTPATAPYGTNPFFRSLPSAALGIEASNDTLKGAVIVPYRFPDGKDVMVGFARTDLGVTPFYAGYDFAESISSHYWEFATMSFVDVDGDGRDEMLLHNGDGFCLFVYRIGEDRHPSLCGTMDCNCGFFITSDHIMVSRLGTQGMATISRLTPADSLEILGDYLDKALMSSERYLELEYEFEDTALNDRSLPRLNQCPDDSYIICDKGSIFGNHVMHTDIDGDGTQEILFIGNQGWGMQIMDEVMLLKGRNSYDILSDALKHNEPEIITMDDYDLRVKGSVQLAAYDSDGDGRKEVVASFGDSGHSTHLFYRYLGGADLSLIRVEHKITDFSVR